MNPCINQSIHTKRATFRVLAINAGIVVAFYIWFQLFYNLVDSHHIWPYDNTRQIAKDVILNLIPISLTYLMNYLLVFKIVRTKAPYIKIVLDVPLSFTGLVLLNHAILFMLSIISPEYSKVNWGGTIFYNSLILLGMEMVYFAISNIRQINKTNEARQHMLRYKYESLKSQVNPHFLFNTLNILYSLVEIDVRKSQKFILSLSRIYRYILDHQDCEKVSVKDELEFIEDYIGILKLRYNNNFNVIIECVTDSYYSIIPFTLQILVENIVKHNKICDYIPMEATIQCKEDGITVINPINRKKPVQNKHMGLNYIITNYARLGKEIHIIDDGVVFNVSVPYIN